MEKIINSENIFTILEDTKVDVDILKIRIE